MYNIIQNKMMRQILTHGTIVGCGPCGAVLVDAVEGKIKTKVLWLLVKERKT